MSYDPHFDPYDDWYEPPTHEEQYLKRTVRWGSIVAIALGALIGIYVGSCGDNRPEAAGAMTQANVIITHFPVRESRGTDFFRVALDNNGGSLVISLDQKLPLAKWLRDHPGKSRLTVEAK